MAKMVGTNLAYSMAKTPMLKDEKDGSVKPFATHRVVQDDIGWGLCVLISIAERLEVELKRAIPRDMMLMMVNWHQRVMGKTFLVDGKLLGKDCSELVLVANSDDLDVVAGVAASKKPGLPSSRGGRSGATREADSQVPAASFAGAAHRS